MGWGVIQGPISYEAYWRSRCPIASTTPWHTRYSNDSCTHTRPSKKHECLMLTLCNTSNATRSAVEAHTHASPSNNIHSAVCIHFIRGIPCIYLCPVYMVKFHRHPIAGRLARTHHRAGNACDDVDNDMPHSSKSIALYFTSCKRQITQ